MQFESKLKRTFWFNSILGLIPDIFISVALSVVFDGGLVGFFFSLVGLQVLYLLIWIKNSIWTWLLFQFSGRKILANTLADYFRENSYPEPNNFEESVEEYFSNIVLGEDNPVELRLKASASLATINFFARQNQMQDHMRLLMVYEDALESYKKTFPSKAGY